MEYCGIIYRLLIFQWSKGHMTSQSSIQKKNHQEFEQGQIESNNYGPGSLALGGSVGIGQYSNLSTYNNFRQVPTEFSSDKNISNSSYIFSPPFAFNNSYEKAGQTLPEKGRSNARQGSMEVQQSRKKEEFETSAYAGNSYQSCFPDYSNYQHRNSYNLNKNNEVGGKIEQQIPAAPKFSRQIYPAQNYKYGQTYYRNNSEAIRFDSYYSSQQLKTQQRDRYTNKIIPADKVGRIEYEKNNKKKESQTQDKKIVCKQEIEKHKPYFRECDWQRLLFIIEEIILENNNGVRNLWNFIKNLEEKKRFRKGKRVFEILSLLGLEEIFDKLIREQEKYKKQTKGRDNKITKLVYKLVQKVQEIN